MADASFSYARNVNPLTVAAAVAVGEIWQGPDGRAFAMSDDTAGSVGDSRNFTDTGKWVCTKTTSFVALKGGRAYWDHSANAVNYKKVNDRDFYIGRFWAAAASADDSCTVEANIDPRYDVDINLDPCLSTIVGTAAAGGFGYPVRLGGAHILELTTTNEAQKVDLLSVDGFSKSSNFVVEGAFRVLSNGAGSEPDFTIGCASGTHATDFQSVASFIAIHLDGNDVNINAESDDTSTNITPTDTTIDYTEGSSVSERVEFWIDGSNPEDVQIYINGSNVLPATTFTLAGSSDTLYLIAHLEKTSSASAYKIAVDWLRVRYKQQD